jgi:hypothetical protein
MVGEQMVPQANMLGQAAVLFFDNYHPTGSMNRYRNAIVCPFNGIQDITDICVKCRRCFNGKAVEFEKYVKK